jgi:hypothetical protein
MRLLLIYLFPALIVVSDLVHIHHTQIGPLNRPI